jgi:hypothetical protein
MSRRVRGHASIFTIIRHSRGSEHLILPQYVTKDWKDVEVGEIKTALECGRLKFAEGRKDYIFSRRHAGEFAHARFLMRDTVGAFIYTCFEPSDFPVLTQDFTKIHRKWIGPNTTTFDAERDGTGHADTFWAAVFGHSVARTQRMAAPATANLYSDTPAKQDYVGLL